jgi:hypothetical protein
MTFHRIPNRFKGIIYSTENLHRKHSDYYYKACRKGDVEAKAVTVNQSAVRALADASEITGLPRDNFEVHETSREEYKDFRHSASP